MIILSGNLLPEAFVSPFTVRRCAQMCLVSVDVEIDSEKYLRLAVRIRCLVLLRYYVAYNHPLASGSTKFLE